MSLKVPPVVQRPAALVSRTRTRGFTLIEIIIATSIALFVFGVGYQAIASTVSSNNITSARIRDTENARLFFDMLQRDLSTAYPGPTYMSKIDGPLPQTGYTPSLTGGNPIILNETASGGPTASVYSDILQFYCRTDHPGAVTDPPEPILFVRYGYNRSDGVRALCRLAVPYDPSTVPAPDQNTGIDPVSTVDLNPLSLTNNTSSDLALFDNVTNLRIIFQRWDAINRLYIREGQPGFNFASADSLLVTLTFGDVRNSHVGVTSTTNINRTYSKVIPIPASLK